MTDFIILDTETTGLGGDAEIVEIAILDDQGNALLNTLVKPSKPIPDDVIAIHGITNEMVADAPTWPDIKKQVCNLLVYNITYAYNAPFDQRMLIQTAVLNGGPSNMYSIVINMNCVMSEYVDKYQIGYDHYSLANAATDLGITFDSLNPHRAASDCAVTLDVLRVINGQDPIATGAHAKHHQTVLGELK